MIIFSVETSCDETSVCILKNSKILSHIVYSQTEHSKFGGVIPELASRSHLQVLQKITNEAFNQANLEINEIDIFCSTCGPGLIGGLLVGSTFTKALAIGCKKPFVPINHLEGHILSPTFNNKVIFPYLCFLLTFEHTQIYIINSINNYELLGETLDDAIGEAFDKVAKLLGMPYPGGPMIEKNALLSKGEKKFEIPHPLKKNKDLNFSFSGIKTAMNLIIKKNSINSKDFVQDISYAFQNKVSDILVHKLILVSNYLKKKEIKISQISLVGGVASNKSILNRMNNASEKLGYSLILPPRYMLADNAAMIAWACAQKSAKIIKSDIMFKPNPRFKI